MSTPNLEYDEQGKAIQSVLNGWVAASPRNGVAAIVPNLKQLYLQAAQNQDSLRVLIAFGGTKPRSAFNVQNKLRREDCIWKIAVTKGDALSANRGDFLIESTSTSEAFLREVAHIRDLFWGMVGISAEYPNDYNNVEPLQLGDAVMSGYMITGSVAHDVTILTALSPNQDPQ